MIDIYSDEGSGYDINFRQGAWVAVLSESLGGVRKAVKTIDQRKPGGRALRQWADGIVVNLGEFCKYRRSLKL